MDDFEFKIADLGAGPKSVISVYSSDVRDINGVEKQDMENLTYPDNSFNMVVCQNALDHTKDAEKALNEMIRICKPGGIVFIKCWLDQKDTGHKHYYNAKEDGRFEGKNTFNLTDYGFVIKYTNKGGERRYNYIEAVLIK